MQGVTRRGRTRGEMPWVHAHTESLVVKQRVGRSLCTRVSGDAPRLRPYGVHRARPVPSRLSNPTVAPCLKLSGAVTRTEAVWVHWQGIGDRGENWMPWSSCQWATTAPLNSKMNPGGVANWIALGAYNPQFAVTTAPFKLRGSLRRGDSGKEWYHPVSPAIDSHAAQVGNVRRATVRGRKIVGAGPASDPLQTWALRRLGIRPNDCGVLATDISKTVLAGPDADATTDPSISASAHLNSCSSIGAFPRGGTRLPCLRPANAGLCTAPTVDPKAQNALTWYSGPESVRRAANYGGMYYDAPHEFCPPFCGGSKPPSRSGVKRSASMFPILSPRNLHESLPPGRRDNEMEE